MRVPRLQFSLGKLMIAVALAGVACWAIVVVPPAIQGIVILCLGPFVGACWRRLFALRPFDPSRRLARGSRRWMRFPQRKIAYCRVSTAGSKGGVIETVLIVMVSAVPIASMARPWTGFPVSEVFMAGAQIAGVAFCLLVLLCLAGYVIGLLVGVLAEAGTRIVTGRQDKA